MLYGMTAEGGIGNNEGVVFSVSIVPEPTSGALLALGLPALIALRRRRASA